MPDVCDLILDDHATFRRRFAELDELRARGADAPACAGAWEPLAELLELHAQCEEVLFYPQLLHEGDDADEETRDALTDHNDIRDGIRDARGTEPGTEPWWKAVLEVRATNSDHIAEEERGAIPDFRVHATPVEREGLGARWLEYRATHGGDSVDADDKDVDRYIARHS